MSKTVDRSAKIRAFILAHVEKHPRDVVRRAATRFRVSRQAINKHVRQLLEDGTLVASGTTSARTYALSRADEWRQVYPLGGLREDAVWKDIVTALGELRANLRAIWQYGCTEMVNNAIDHSGGKSVSVTVSRSPAARRVDLYDDGVGIFKKVQASLSLGDERHAALELTKGKFTTDPARHSGEGIFFTARAFDRFTIASGGISLMHRSGSAESWIVGEPEAGEGTLVRMELDHETKHTLESVFDQFSDPESFAFNKTAVPVSLLEYGDDNVVSRSQAKRLLTRFDRFEVVVLDFAGVKSIGQAFADEIFRVFANEHPEVELSPIHANEDVARMIGRARGVARRPSPG